jgi:glycosyltransferase involved in cell wall biosynthesis
MVEVVYYSPAIPDVQSTVRYVHAEAVPVHVESATLVTESPPPESIRAAYDDVIVLDGGVVRNARAAAGVAEDAAATGDRTLFLTTFHYGPALAGTLADVPWVVDVFDNPLQYALNNPDSYHRVTARVLLRVVDRADGVVHDYHPAGPVLGRDSRFITEGCPTELVEPTFEAPDDRLECVWAGSPRLDRGMDTLIEALAPLDEPVTVDVYGDADEEVTALARRHGVADRLTFHGRTDHAVVCDGIGEAHAGLCVLPGRRDWRHSAPVKVREYLAGGTIPVCSEFPGMRLTAESAGVYTDPSPDALAATLRRLLEIGRTDLERYVEKMQFCRGRAEARPLDTAGEWFVRQCLDSGLGVVPF